MSTDSKVMDIPVTTAVSDVISASADTIATSTAPIAVTGATTASGRTVKLTEKAAENVMKAKHKEMTKACGAWEKQYCVLKELLQTSTDATELQQERDKLLQYLEDVTTIVTEARDVLQLSEKEADQVEGVKHMTRDISADVSSRTFVKKQESIKSKPRTASRRSRSCKSNVSARARELELKLRFMNEEEELQREADDLRRKQILREQQFEHDRFESDQRFEHQRIEYEQELERQAIERRRDRLKVQQELLIVRADADDKQDDEQSLFSDGFADSTRDRVNDYVMNQNPANAVTELQHAQTAVTAAENMPPAVNMSASAPPITSQVISSHMQTPIRSTNAYVYSQQPQAPLMSTMQIQSSGPTYQPFIPATTVQPRVNYFNANNAPMRAAETAPTYSTLNQYANTFIPEHTQYNTLQQQPPAAVYQPTAAVQQSGISELTQAFQQQMYINRLPPPEPGVFSGDPIQFPGWLTSFEMLIENRQISAAERLHYLQRYLSGEAKECIVGFVLLSTDNAYSEAKKLLMDRYGNNFTIANAFRRKLHEWPKIALHDGKGLMKLSDFMLHCATAMESNAYLRVLDDCHENQKIVAKLPEWLANRWSRIVSEWCTKRDNFPPFNEFCGFITSEAKIANNPLMAIQYLKPTNKRQDDVKAKKHVGATATAPKQIKADDGSHKRYSSKGFGTRPTGDVKKSTDNIKKSTDDCKEWKRRPCTLCEGEHFLDVCQKFLKKKLADRQEFVKESRLCFGCLKPNHQAKDCWFRAKCSTCKRRHPTSLHDDNWTPMEKEQHDVAAATTVTEKVTVARTNTNIHSCSTSMTVPVYVSSADDPEKEELVYALLDTQSNASFITEQTCERLRVDGPMTEVTMSTMSSTNDVFQTRKISNLLVRGYNSEKRIEILTLYTRPAILGSLEHVPTSDTARKWDHLKVLEDVLPPILDIDFGLLIGFNCSEALAPQGVITSSTNPKEPYAQLTGLGWCIVGGPTAENHNSTCHRTAVMETQGRASIVHKVKVKEVFKPSDFLQMTDSAFDEYPEERKQSYDDYKFIQQLTGGIHDTNGHYEMPLPFKEQETRLPNNKIMAMKRLEQLKRRLLKDAQYRQDYEAFMKTIIERGDCEKVPTNHNHEPGRKWYIPHHGVYHPKKPGKIRVVFDCSASYQGTSLNDHLLQGPDMINDLIGVLCRFRKEPIAISCDIEKMFHQFKVNEEHRDYLTLLWWDDGDYEKEPTEYRMTVHLFGAASSPGCANFGMNQAAQDGEPQFGTAAADFIRNNFYVDDGITSVATVQEGTELVQNTVNLCANKGLRLHKFLSNSSEVLECLPATEHAMDIKTLELDHEHLTVERTLGLEWCIQLDCFQFKIVLKDRPPTRRGILSTVYSLYDPLGLLSPVILQGRRILQDICKDKHDWDSPLPDDIIKRWMQWRESLFELEQLKIDRCYKPKDFKDLTSVQLHHFSDASTEGYGQCSYLRLVDTEGRVHCSLVMAKARVTPLKQMTIPRLELAAAVLSVRISTVLRKQLHYDDIEEHFWCDSQVTLGYIRNDAKRFHVFVANRIQQIRNVTEPHQWHYVSSKDNPADAASRGLSVQGLLSKSTWFNGPEFLWDQKVPTDDVTEYVPQVSVDDPEMRKQTFATDTDEQEGTFDLQRFEYFSDWTRLKKAVTLCLQYKAILKDRIAGHQSVKRKDITVEDMRTAETEIIRIVQDQAFAPELEVFKASSDKPHVQRQLKRKHALYRLDPFMDKKGVLRIGGRISAASLAKEVKHPAVLPKNSHVAKLIVKHCHVRSNHQGRGITINQIRTHGYWIIGCKGVVSSLITKCVTCKRLRGTVLDQKMADLPSDRVEPSPPFTYCGVDYFGPFYIKERRSTLKRYGVIFTCMSSRAVHIETANSMDTDSFINALRRFIAVRGPIRQLRSDQGTNFVGAKRELYGELNSLNQQQIKDFLQLNSCDFIEFRMNVPSASHMGGVWERQIRTVRNVFSAILETSSQQLDDESLRTFMYEAMAIVNGRPLTVETLSDASSTEPLTPNHFLHMKTSVVLPPPGEFQEPDMYGRKRWRRVQHLLNMFWKRWQKEFLVTLQKRQKWGELKVNLNKGDIVIIKDENLARNKWLLARVDETIPSSDGAVRKVRLQIATQQLDRHGKRTAQPSFLERPIHKLVLLCREPQST